MKYCSFFYVLLSIQKQRYLLFTIHPDGGDGKETKLPYIFVQDCLLACIRGLIQSHKKK